MAVIEKLGRWRSATTEEEELRVFEKELANLDPDEAEALVLLLNEMKAKKPVSVVREYSQPDGSTVIDAGGSLLSLIQEVEFNKPVVSVEEWLTDSYFMGNSGFRWERWKEDLIELFTGSYHQCILTGAIGIGKAQPLSAQVLTPGGFVLMGSLKVGDLVVGADGKPTTVRAVHERGVREVFRVSFSDGTSTECCSEHLWAVSTADSRAHGRGSKVLELRELMSGLFLSNGSPKYQVQCHASVQFAAEQGGVELPVAPYLLGLVLGDGDLTSSTIRFTKPEYDLWDRIEALVDAEDQVVRNHEYGFVSICGKKKGDRKPSKTAEAVKGLGLWGLDSKTKWIPKQYMTASIADRIDLLRGLCDSDGSVTGSGCQVEYSTSSEQLAEDVVFLARSLGAIVSVKKRLGCYRKNGERHETSDSWRVLIGFQSDLCPVSSEKNLGKWRGACRLWKSIVAVESVGDARTRCITVDRDDGLYLTDDFIVTHNSTFVEMALCRMIYEFSCLRDPQRTYDLMPGSKIFIACMNVNKTLAKEVVYDKVANRIDSCEYFKKEFPMEYTMKEIRFPNSLKIVPASSSDTALLGLNVIGGVMSETNFMDGGHQAKSKSQSAAFKASWASHGLTSDVGHVFSELVTRLKSRFGRVGKLPGLFLLDSSKRDQSDWMESHMVESKDDPFVFVRDYAMWEVQPPNRFDKKKFRVFVGDEKVSSRILGDEDEAVPEAGSKQQIIEVPENWRPEFERNLEAAIRNVAGIATSSIDRLFGTMDPVARAMDRGKGFLESPFGTDVWVMDKPIGAKWDRIAKVVDGAWKLNQDPKAEHATHFDIAYARDRFGLGIGYIAGEKQVEKIVGGNRVIETWPHIVIRWVLALQAPRDKEIEIGVGRALIWSAMQHGHKVRWGSCDLYQSIETIQKFRSKGIDADVLSVESEAPYLCLKDAFYEDRMTVCESALLYEELRYLVHDKAAQKVDHPPKRSKDLADVVAGITYRLTMLYLDGKLRVGTGAFPGISELYEDEELEEQYWVLGPGAGRPVEHEERNGIVGGGADRATDQHKNKPFIVK